MARPLSNYGAKIDANLFFQSGDDAFKIQGAHRTLHQRDSSNQKKAFNIKASNRNLSRKSENS
jgi:hypothetical protein